MLLQECVQVDSILKPAWSWKSTSTYVMLACVICNQRWFAADFAKGKMKNSTSLAKLGLSKAGSRYSTEV